MALTAKRKAELARMALPSDQEMTKRIRDFILRAGLSQAEFGQQIGYSIAAINLYLSGRYGENHPTEANTRAIRAAAKEFMDVHEISQDVRLRGNHYETDAFIEVRRAALNALEKGSAYLVDGPPGTEKTWSLRQIEREINEHNHGRAVYVYARVRHSPQSFLQECCTQAGIPNRGPIDMLLRKLRFFLSGGRTLLMIDEAQHLDHSGLEVLRQLLDLPPHFGVLLAGSHDLTQRLSHWQMEQGRSRLRKTIYLNGPTVAESRRILRAELGGYLSDADCDEAIAGCKAKAMRVHEEQGRQVNKTFHYISARDLFGAIERVNDLRETPRKEGAA